MADVASSVEATCVSPAGVAGQVPVLISMGSTGVEQAMMQQFWYTADVEVQSALPAVISA